MLWGRAASRCSFPGCGIELVIDATQTDRESIVGDVCHIVWEDPGGPRGVSSLSLDERNEYDNLILLCKNHHKLVDDLPAKFTVEALHEMKARHEETIRRSLSINAPKQRDEELYASHVDEWAARVGLAQWNEWTCHLLNEVEPRMATSGPN